jgi:hypothetical protein
MVFFLYRDRAPGLGVCRRPGDFLPLIMIA